MKLFLNLLILFFTSVAFSQSYVEKQSLTQSNELTNPGFENGKLGWTVGGGTLTSVSHTTKTKNNSFKGVFAGGVTSGCTTITLGSQLKGSDLEFGGQYKYIQNATPSVAAYPTKITVSLNTGQSVSSTVVSTYTATDNDQWLDMPLMVLSVPTSATTASLCFDQPNGAISFGSYPYEGTFQVDSLYLGSKKSFTNGAILTALKDEPSFTVTNGGTITNASFRSRRDGSMLEVFFKFTTGSNGDLQINIPGYTVHTILPASVNSRVGSFTNSTVGAYSFNVLTQPGLSYVYFGLQGSGSDGLTRYTGWGASTFSGSFKIPISGWAGTGVTYESRCPNDISCENTFTAQISSTGVVSLENLDWISGNCTNANPKVCTFNTGIVTQPMTCLVTNNGAGGRIGTITLSSSTQVAFGTDPGTYDSNVVCFKNAADWVAKKTITGYLSNTVTTSGQRIERMESGIVTGATPYLSSCTTTPCNLVSQSGGASSVTRSGTGVYSINFQAGTFSTPISCTVRGSAYGVTNNAHCSGDPTSSTTTVPLSCQNAATGASVDMQFSYICTGGR